MILREMILDSLQMMPQPAKSNTPAPEKTDPDKPQFCDVLSSTVKAGEKSNASPRTSSNTQVRKTSDDQSDNRPEIKTFREVQNAARHEAAKSEASGQAKPAAAAEAEGADKDGASEKTGLNDGSADKLINCLAQVLGMNPGEFKQLLKAADITTEELSAMTDVKQLVSKLSTVLDLSPEQSKTLNEVLDLFKTEFQAITIKNVARTETAAMADQPKPAEGDTAAHAANANANAKLAPEIEIIKVQNNPESEFSAIMSKLKLKLNELKEKLTGSKEALTEEISQKISALFPRQESIQESNSDTMAVKASDSAEPVVNKTAPVQNDSKQDSAGSKEGKGEDRQEIDAVKPVASAVQDSDGNKTQTAVPVNAQVQTTGETVQVEKAAGKAPVQPRDIINQVLEKAKVIISGDKSEMVMDLKPDSLGKLSLKVVTENGIVTARFVAENQQVKQVLETNMQILKDSLEKQGMNVQGFSVSVRQDSQQGNNSQYQQGMPVRTSVRRTAFGSERLMAAADRIEAVERRNPYSLETSTVSFTA